MWKTWHPTRKKVRVAFGRDYGEVRSLTLTAITQKFKKPSC
jgi:hypothetical protein